MASPNGGDSNPSITTREIIQRLSASRVFEHTSSPRGQGLSLRQEAQANPNVEDESGNHQTTMRSELEQRFPTLSQSRFAPYVPRHTYRPPASSTRFPRRRASTVVGVAKKFTKDIILLARADGDSIPRGSKRAVLHDEARIANMVDFQSSWNERQVMERIESCFKGVIDLAKPYPRLQFLKACGATLKVPNVEEGFEWIGERVRLISSHSDLYVRSLHPLLPKIPAGTTSSASLQCQPGLPSHVESRLSLGSAIQDLRSAHSSEPGPSPLCLESQQRSEPGPSTSSTYRSAQAMLFSPQHVQPLANEVEQSTSRAVASSSSHASSDDSPRYVPSPPSSLSDVDSEVCEADVKVLKEMFPEVPDSTIRHLRVEQSMSTNDVIDMLISQQEKAKPISLQVALARHSRTIIDFNDEYVLKTNRSCIWNKAQVFYKRAISTSHNLLKRALMIEFSGEEGADAGALTFEFFETVLQKVNEEWFEGSDTRRIPRCHWGCETELLMAGCVIAHSILLGGPGFPCIHPAIFHMMIFGDLHVHLSDVPADDLPTAEDIPRDASTIDLLEMISKLDTANTQESINDIVDDPRYMAILNSSGWPIMQCITPSSKAEFLQKLVLSEVIFKRQQAIQALCSGLDRLNVMNLLKEHPEAMKAVFVFDPQQALTADTLIRAISTPKPSTGYLRQVYEWFIEYITCSECREASLEDVLSFATGLRQMPPMGLKERLKIEYLDRSPLPMAEACFSIIKLPTVHMDKVVFFSKLDQGIQNSIGHFGQV